MLATSCGHSVSCVDDLYGLQLKGIDENGKHIIEYVCFCCSCAGNAQNEGRIIKNKQEEHEWLSSEGSATSYNLIERATFYSESKDSQIAEFAREVLKLLSRPLTHSEAVVVLRVDTLGDFTLTLGNNVAITGVGKVEFASVEDAITALKHAKITWVRPLIAHIPGEIYTVQEHDTSMYNFFTRYCSDAVDMLQSGTQSFVVTDNRYRISYDVV